jgi:uncharacterized protein YecE (DUF72 family)
MANTERIFSESSLRVGTAGWSYSDWSGNVFPSNRPHGFHEAAFLAEYFSVLEITSSFYRPLRQEVSRVWAQKLAGAQNFEFTAKLHRSFTHEGNLDPAAVRQFELGLEPLIDNGLLGCLLAQFPESFRLSATNLSHVARLARAFSRYPLVAEFPHASWNNSRALAALADLGIGFCNIDQPQLSQSMPPTAHVTSPISYVRFRGRNYQEPRNDDSYAPAQPGQDYLYSAQQLAKWRPRLDQLARSSEKLYVVTDNHVAGQSVANALQIQAMMLEERVATPPALLERFPDLNCIALDQPSPRSLFFEGAKSPRAPFGNWIPPQPNSAATLARV